MLEILPRALGGSVNAAIPHRGYGRNMPDESPRSSENSKSADTAPPNSEELERIATPIDKQLERGSRGLIAVPEIGIGTSVYDAFQKLAIPSIRPPIFDIQPALFATSMYEQNFEELGTTVAQLAGATALFESYQNSVSNMLAPSLEGIASLSTGLLTSSALNSISGSLDSLAISAFAGSQLTAVGDIFANSLAEQSDRMRQVINAAIPTLNLAYFSQTGGPLDVLGEIRNAVAGHEGLHQSLFQTFAATQSTSGLGRNYGGVADQVHSMVRLVEADQNLQKLDESIERLLDAEQATADDVHEVAEMLGWLRGIRSGIRRTRSEDVVFGLVIGMCMFAFQDPSTLWLPERVWNSLVSGAAATVAIGVFRRESDEE